MQKSKWYAFLALIIFIILSFFLCNSTVKGDEVAHAADNIWKINVKQAEANTPGEHSITVAKVYDYAFSTACYIVITNSFAPVISCVKAH